MVRSSGRVEESTKYSSVSAVEPDAHSSFLHDRRGLREIFALRFTARLVHLANCSRVGFSHRISGYTASVPAALELCHTPYDFVGQQSVCQRPFPSSHRHLNHSQRDNLPLSFDRTISCVTPRDLERQRLFQSPSACPQRGRKSRHKGTTCGPCSYYHPPQATVESDSRTEQWHKIQT